MHTLVKMKKTTTGNGAWCCQHRVYALLAFVSLLGCFSGMNATEPPDFSRMHVSFDDRTRSMFFWQSSWWHDTDKYPVKYSEGQWLVQALNGSWIRLNAPFVKRYGESWHLILERDGRIFVNSDDNQRQHEIRWRNDEWEESESSGEWSSVRENELIDSYENR